METANYYLALSGVLTVLLWIPYILSRMITWGLPGFLHSYPKVIPQQSEWEKRAQRVHLNMVETMPAFIAVVLAANYLAVDTAIDTIGLWAQVFFYARVVHAFVFSLAIPYLRTPTYLVSWAAILMIGAQVIM
ncbi:MAPEG family protein [Parashewanella spongiae]|uniref:MAPEG family protein n=2 Tax=Parashewanella spongiae TaxID=342950 RepID=A0A3A6U7I9_9GAMM|nr:MAPEG family protein [Parashewanella spongiae]MCL1078745.1 MAPEG family protein [Parashewanella spongiae]RJY12510.1 MAPEG family protein [Parashewanella spongiae]